MKHVLVIAYHFPPAGGIPVRRILRFLRYLPEFGWRCSVLTAKDPFDPYHPHDIEGIQSLPPVERTIRVPAHAATEKILYRCYNLLSKNIRSRHFSIGTQGWFRRWIGNTVFFPDPKRQWSREALDAGISLNSQDPFDLVFATGYPWSALQVATQIGKTTQRPVVLDMRDAWVQNPRNIWSSRYHQRLEKRIFSSASTIVTATSGVEKAIRNHYSSSLSVPVTTVKTGFDLAEEPTHDPDLKDSKVLTITYTGTFNDSLPPSPYDQTPYYLLKAIAKVRTRLEGYVKIRLVGRVSEGYRKWILNHNLQHIVTVEGPVTHRRALQHQLAADILLVILSDAPGMDGVLTGKFVEYLGANRPIWAIAPPGELAREVESLGGWVDSPRNVESIAKRLERLLDVWFMRNLSKPSSPPARYSARSSAEALAKIFST